jgi:hypothetical protein
MVRVRARNAFLVPIRNASLCRIARNVRISATPRRINSSSTTGLKATTDLGDELSVFHVEGTIARTRDCRVMRHYDDGLLV